MCRNLIKWKTLFVLCVLLSFWFQTQVFSIDLTREIASEFQKYYNNGYTDEYLNVPYSSVFSKDPYNDSLKNMEGMSKQLKISWVQNVENALENYNCSISQEKIWAMLYYFVPEFRTEIARMLKLELWDMDSKDFVYSENEIYDYCLEYFSCFENNYKDPSKITAGSAANPMTSCKEFFEKYYEEWEYNEKRFQNLQLSQLWVDKYWNSTTDDGSYDIMMDLWVIGKLLFEEAVAPITPVFYNLPLFSNSKNSLKNKWVSSSSSNGSDLVGGRTGGWWASERGGWWVILNSNDWIIQRWDWLNGWVSVVGVDDVIPIPVPWWFDWFSMEWWYDELVEWLWSYGFKNNSSYFWSLCKEEDSVQEPEIEDDFTNYVNQISTWRDLSKLTDDEYEDLIDYMLDSVDKYTTLPDSKEEEIKRIVWNNDYSMATNEVWLDKVANEIKNCRKSCEWLRLDQKASCMLMCACWEIKAPIFNPEITPWLWSIFMIRFCTIPAVDTRFALWWRKIFSIEEWAKEIFGVTDKLSREWKLWIRTQQNNFLDSTTKNIKIKDTVSFTMSVEWVDISKKFSTQSDQYKGKMMKSNNDILQQEYGISNSLSNNVLKNRYRLVGYEWEDIDELRWSSNSNDARDRTSELSITPELPVDPSANSHAHRYNEIANTINKWLDEQWSYRAKSMEYIKDADSYAQALYAKRW